MDALFIVPTMVSPNVNERLVPALAKMIERNILLTNHASFRAVMVRNFHRSEDGSNYKEDDDVLNEEEEKPQSSLYGNAITRKGIESIIGNLIGRKSREDIDKGGGGNDVTDVEKIELPKGITFFHMISLEPTYLQVPVAGSSGMFLSPTSKLMTVGVKCVPYKLNGVNSILSAMDNIQAQGIVKRFFLSKWEGIKTKLPISRWKRIRKGERGGDHTPMFGNDSIKYDVADDIIFSPSSSELSKPKYLSKMIRSGDGTAHWSTLVVLSTFDFPDENYQDKLSKYRDLVSGRWGDMIIMNEPKETVHFCTQKLRACYELPIPYLKQILNLNNVIDYSEVSKFSRPFSRIGSIGNALREDVDVDWNLLDRMDELIKE